MDSDIVIQLNFLGFAFSLWLEGRLWVSLAFGWAKKLLSESKEKKSRDGRRSKSE